MILKSFLLGIKSSILTIVKREEVLRSRQKGGIYGIFSSYIYICMVGVARR